ncbi:MAG TPA: hypothetical protein VMG12_05195 [Polyangiaceae bacterium]|nr:hypothetical protein [Polyangiaceae bacterium]
MALGVASACTLASDEFEPELVAPAPTAGSGSAAALPPAGCAGAACDAGNGGDGGNGGAASEPCVGTECPAPPERPDAGAACAAGACDSNDDCASSICSDGCCALATCSDGVANGGESGVDCGGACAARCGSGQGCRSTSDCAAGLGCPASLARCTPAACDNGVLDGAEIRVDCGGGECAGCADGTECETGADCASASCSGAGLCAAPACDDGVRNQDELGVDCGGACALPCPAGSACTLDAQCTSGVCGGGACALSSDTQCCVAASCGDGVLNGGEADLDCGSADPLCPRCEAGRLCQSDAQCASGACEAGRCCGGSTGDCTRCAERLSPTVDCATAPPGGSANCAAFLQCLASNAGVCTTRFAAGCTNDPGGACNHNTYGGNDGLGVQHAARVLAEAGCTP